MKCVPYVVSTIAAMCLAFHIAGRPDLTTFGFGEAHMRVATAVCLIAASYIAIRTRARKVGTIRQQMTLGISINAIAIFVLMAIVGQLWPHVGVTLGVQPNFFTIASLMTIAIKGVLIVNGNNNRAVILIALANLCVLAWVTILKFAGIDWFNNSASGMSFTTIAMLSLLFVSDIHGRGWGAGHVCTVKAVP